MTFTPRLDVSIAAVAEPKRMDADAARLASITALREHLLQSPNERLPAAQNSVPRSVQADAVLDTILGVATDLPLDDNSRCVLYSLATAILTCPGDVRLTLDVSTLPSFLKPAGYHDANEAPLTEADLITRQRSCGTCGTAFVAPQKTVFIRYQNLVGQLMVGGDPPTPRWHGEHANRPCRAPQ